jgi:hypothetical protein
MSVSEAKMNGIHDIGGKHRFGPIIPEPHEPPFHTSWEGRMRGISVTCQVMRAGATGRLRCFRIVVIPQNGNAGPKLLNSVLRPLNRKAPEIKKVEPQQYAESKFMLIRRAASYSYAASRVL